MSQQTAAPESNWWGEKPAWVAAVHSPNAAARQSLVEACGPEGSLGVDGALLSDPDLFRRARVRTHPDRHFGDRSGWDQVEEAGRALGLVPRP